MSKVGYGAMVMVLLWCSHGSVAVAGPDLPVLPQAPIVTGPNTPADPVLLAQDAADDAAGKRMCSVTASKPFVPDGLTPGGRVQIYGQAFVYCQYRAHKPEIEVNGWVTGGAGPYSVTTVRTPRGCDACTAISVTFKRFMAVSFPCNSVVPFVFRGWGDGFYRNSRENYIFFTPVRSAVDERGEIFTTCVSAADGTESKEYRVVMGGNPLDVASNDPLMASSDPLVVD